MAQNFTDGIYTDVPGLCKVATLDEIKAQGWSLNPGWYVGVKASPEEDFDFKVRFAELNEELNLLNLNASELHKQIVENIEKILSDK